MRGSFRSRVQHFDNKLRHSTNYLNSQILRGSFTRNLSSNKFRDSNVDKFIIQQRFSSLNKVHSHNIVHQQSSSQHFAHLKKTLSQLQNKIQKAQQVLSKSYDSTANLHNNILDCQETISEIESNITKKNEYTYNQITENSTKYLSFAKNQSVESLPFKRDTKATSNSKYIKNKKLYYISSILQIGTNKQDKRILQHLTYSMKTFHYFSKILAPDYESIEQNKINIPIAHKNKGKKTLLLDIDDTILQCIEQQQPGYQYDFKIQLQVNQSQMAIGFIYLRPYALTFLKNMSQVYEIIAFTASHKSYINAVLDQLDPDNQIFSYRIYKDNCHELQEGAFTKDIRIINRNPQKTVLVDNSSYSYILQLQNGIPILPFQFGNDYQLPKLQKYLQMLSRCEDVREVNKTTFQLHRYTEFAGWKDMVHRLYGYKVQ